MYPNMCPMSMHQMPMCWYCMMPYNTMVAGQMMQYGMPHYDEYDKGKDDDKKHECHRDENVQSKEQLRGYRFMRDEQEPTEDRNADQGMEMPPTDQMGKGNAGQFISGMPGMFGQMPGSAMQGVPEMPMQQMMSPEQGLQMIERNNPEIIRMMTGLNIPITTVRQIILSILQVAQTNMQMPGR